MMEPKRISIIGGGACGALVAIHLLRSGKPLEITLFERERQLGRGIAYSGEDPGILLNVPAARMSPLPDEPALFFDWASTHPEHPLLGGKPVTPQAFLSRALYGQFLNELLLKTAKESAHGTLTVINSAVQQIRRVDGHWRASGSFSTVEADQVVLALGNPPPTLLPALSSLPAARIINPWRGLTFDHRTFGDAVLCVGSGLTAVDVVAKLHSLGYTGKIHLISRHGLLPHRHHTDPLQVSKTKLTPPTGSLRTVLRSLRQQIAAAETLGDPWQLVLDTLRPAHQAIWQSLSHTEQQRFIRHLSAYWEIHRHRLAPELHALVTELLEAQKLIIHSAAITQADATSSGLSLAVRHRGTDQATSLQGSHLFLCTGPARTISAWDNPLIEGLLTDKFIEQDPLGIGFRPTPSGTASDLYVIGSALRGTLWESTAMRELALQAKEIAQQAVARVAM